MNKKLLIIVGFGMVAALALTLAADSQAGLLDKFRRNKTPNKLESSVQTAAGTYSGALRGEIRLGGQKVLITKDTMVYLVGQGARKNQGMMVSERTMGVYGKKVGDVLVAETIIVRPEASHQMRAPRMTPSSIQVTPSDVNPNVGIVERGPEE